MTSNDLGHELEVLLDAYTKYVRESFDDQELITAMTLPPPLAREVISEDLAAALDAGSALACVVDMFGDHLAEHVRNV